jgi:Peptidase family M48
VTSELQAMPLQALTPLPYHRQLVDYLKKHEAQVWDACVAVPARQQLVEETRTRLLRETYRLEPESHPSVYNACKRAMLALQLDVPVTIYQAGSGEINAALCFVPGEIHIVLYGSVTERLDEQELTALMGHELSHYRLWSESEGDFYIAANILDHALAFPEVRASHIESDRLFALTTELYADRGALIAVNASEPPITLLLKTITGLSNPDAAAYLRQAAEIEQNAGKSTGISHPEVFLRAQAMDRWWRSEPDVDLWIQKRLSGPLALEKLDLLGQVKMSQITRGLLSYLVADVDAQEERLQQSAKSIVPDWSSDDTAITPAQLKELDLDASVHDYLFALVFDLAQSDPDFQPKLLETGARLALHIGLEDSYRVALKRDLKWNKQQIDRLIKKIHQP